MQKGKPLTCGNMGWCFYERIRTWILSTRNTATSRTITNTGSVVHTVNYIWARLKRSNGETHEFRMQTELDAIPPKKAPIARGFGVAPNSNVVKLIGFASDIPTVELKAGEYIFSLYAWVDGKKPTSQHVSFSINLLKSKIDI